MNGRMETVCTQPPGCRSLRGRDARRETREKTYYYAMTMRQKCQYQQQANSTNQLPIQQCRGDDLILCTSCWPLAILMRLQLMHLAYEDEAASMWCLPKTRYLPYRLRLRLLTLKHYDHTNYDDRQAHSQTMCSYSRAKNVKQGYI